MINSWLEEESLEWVCKCGDCEECGYHLDESETEEEYYVSRSNGRV